MLFDFAQQRRVKQRFRCVSIRLNDDEMLLNALPGYSAMVNGPVNVNRVWLAVVRLPPFIFCLTGVLDNWDSVGPSLKPAFILMGTVRISFAEGSRFIIWERSFGCLLLLLVWLDWNRKWWVEAMEGRWATRGFFLADGIHNELENWAFLQWLYYFVRICRRSDIAWTDSESSWYKSRISWNWDECAVKASVLSIFQWVGSERGKEPDTLERNI